MSRSSFVLCLLLIFAAGATLRIVWLRADPPTVSVGVVWHDEGPWTHNARNRALFGVWRTDDWNPVFVAPVFTALEYVAFETFGVGLWQARSVSVAAGLAAVAFLAAGLGAIGGRRVALFGATLLATNYFFVMWNRAALMESTMTAFIVAGWAAYAMAERRPAWGLVAGVAAALAWFTKAAAAFFVGAILLDVAVTLLVAWSPAIGARLGMPRPTPAVTRAAWLTIAGLAGTAALIVALFVAPYWSEYRFYNWQMSVTRKPSYAMADLLTRASWLPIVQDFFSRMWLALAAGLLALAGIAARWRTARAGERLLVLWMLVGLAELTVHDSGTERRYVMFIPAIIGLASLLAAGGGTLLPAGLATAGPRGRLVAVPLVLLCGYLAFGSLVRVPLLDEVRAGHFSLTVRLSAGLAVLLAAGVVGWWSAVVGWLGRTRVTPAVAATFLGIAVAWNLGSFALWAADRTDLNYRASVEVGRILPEGALVQGKLANGLALDNRIHPLFIGNGFGNFEGRLERDDVRYILTYTLPAPGYESGQDGLLIQELLDHYPARELVATFEVQETPAPDLAALFDKRGGRDADAAADGTGRARD